jgi:hypothetical protein
MGGQTHERTDSNVISCRGQTGKERREVLGGGKRGRAEIRGEKGDEDKKD